MICGRWRGLAFGMGLPVRFCCALFLATVVSGYVMVEQKGSSFDVDVAEWNGANWSTALPERIYFTYSASDVVSALDDAMRANLSIVTRSGRHQYTGLRLAAAGSYRRNGHVQSASSLLEGCVEVSSERFCVIDVSNITGIAAVVKRYDHAQGSPTDVVVGAGERQFFVYKFGWENGLLLPGGTCPTVGISGFLLGGGYGFFGRKYSIAADHIESVEMVVIDANRAPKVINVSRAASGVTPATPFWALLGGGNNNFGVATSFTLRLVPIETNLNYTRIRITFSDVNDCTQTVIQLYEEIAPWAPRELYLQLVVYSNACAIFAAVEGDVHYLNRTLQVDRWLEITSATTTGANTTSYEDLVITLAGCAHLADCVNRTKYATPSPQQPDFFGAFSIFVERGLGGEGLSVLMNSMSTKPDALGFTFAEFDPYGPSGAVNALDANATAFPHRNALYHIQCMVYWDDVADTTVANTWLEGVFAKLSQFGSGSYRNYPASWLPNAAQRYFKGNLKDLATVKEDMDSHNLFLTSLF